MADAEPLRVWFQSVDADSSGSINVSELQQALAAGNLRFPSSMVAQMIRMYDRDLNGAMSFDEFVSLHKFLSVVQNAFTTNSSKGVLGLEAMHKALAQAGYTLDQPSFYMTCQSFDSKRTAQFRLDDFISICIYLQSARNLFDAFDTSRQGRITLDFNQFVYCGRAAVLCFCLLFFSFSALLYILPDIHFVSLLRCKPPDKKGTQAAGQTRLSFRLAMAEQATHRFVEANGIKIHVAEMGTGPTVILLHGFPESWYTWRFQLKALADAGFHAVAPDLRGYGLTECPKDEFGRFKLTPQDVVGDLVGLIYELGGEPVFVVAHDAGAFPGWNICLMRPDLVKGFVSIGIPFMGKFGVPADEGFYVNRFAIPGRAEKDFGRFDTATVLKNIYILFCRSELQIAGPDEEIMDLVKPSETPPSWLTDEFLKVQAELYDKSGFEGPLWFTYRDQRRKFELVAPWQRKVITTRCLYLMGKDDYVLKFPNVEAYLKNGGMKSDIPNLTDIVCLPGGHFVEEDSPDAVNEQLISFFQGK